MGCPVVARATCGIPGCKCELGRKATPSESHALVTTGFTPMGRDLGKPFELSWSTMKRQVEVSSEAAQSKRPATLTMEDIAESFKMGREGDTVVSSRNIEDDSRCLLPDINGKPCKMERKHFGQHDGR